MKQTRDWRWLSFQEAASLRLAGLPTTAGRTRDLAERRGWLAPEHEGVLWRPRQGRGGGVEISVRVLPPAQRRVARRRWAKVTREMLEARRDAALLAAEILAEELAAFDAEMAALGDDDAA